METAIWMLLLMGLITGSVLNLCADSLPVARRVRPLSCAHCGQPRPAIAHSAVLAYLSGRHRCPSCAAPISIRRVLVELVAALLFVFAWLRTGATPTTVLHIAYGSVLILILVTDLEHRLIPHTIMLPAIAFALLGAFINPAFDSPKRALLGGGIGLFVALTLYFVGGLFTWSIGRIRGQPVSEVAFGFGDVTLITFIGLIVGAPEVLLAIAIGLLSGGVFAALYLIVRGLFQRRYTIFTAIPYGPFLILGGATMLYYGQELMAWYSTR